MKFWGRGRIYLQRMNTEWHYLNIPNNLELQAGFCDIKEIKKYCDIKNNCDIQKYLCNCSWALPERSRIVRQKLYTKFTGKKKIRVCVRTRKYPLIWIVILKCAQDTCDREINTNHKWNTDNDVQTNSWHPQGCFSKETLQYFQGLYITLFKMLQEDIYCLFASCCLMSSIRTGI